MVVRSRADLFVHVKLKLHVEMCYLRGVILAYGETQFLPQSGVCLDPALARKGNLGFSRAVEKSAKNNLLSVSCYSCVALKGRNQLMMFLLPFCLL